MKEPKEKVVRLFLEMVGSFVRLSEMRIATLGGYGLEARVWQELGIPPENGWLIEHNRKYSGKLVSKYRYRTQNHLGTFHQTMIGLGEEQSSIDAMHLDLCGTFSGETVADFKSVLPLILKSRGRCLAITVADARRNSVLEEWPKFEKRGQELFGKKGQSEVYDRILETQNLIPTNPSTLAFIKPFDPVKGAKREFGLLVELARMLTDLGQNFAPTTVVRYVYVSHYVGRPFRMRTYFFRFDKKVRTSRMSLADTWVNSKLFFASGDAFQEIREPASKPENLDDKGESISMSKLAELVKVLGGTEEAEYNRLVMKSQQLDGILVAINGVTVPSATKPVTLPPNTEIPEVKQTTRRKTKTEDWDSFSEAEKIHWLIRTRELKAHHGNKWPGNSWEDHLTKTIGYYDIALGYMMRANLAQVGKSGSDFRKRFKARVETAFGAEAKPYLDRLAKLQ